jgi:hypothetical protein
MLCTQLSKVKIKCTFLKALKLCKGRTARKGVEVQLYPFLTTALEGGEASASRPGRFSPGKDPVSVVQKAWWAPGLDCTGPEDIATTGFDPPTF